MRDPILLISIALFGGVGALFRYFVSYWANQAFQTAFPVGTLLVNVIGCCLLGALNQAANLSPGMSPTARAAIGVGLLGAMTTFSTFGAETLEQINHGAWFVAAANIVANVVVGLLAVAVGAAAIRGLMT